MEREALLIRTLVDLADNLVADYDIVDVLTTLASRAVALLDSEAAGILLPDDSNTLRVVAASSEDSSLLELFELQSARGPAFECFGTGIAQSSADLAGSPWPDLADALARLGFHSSDALPMRLRGEVIGTMSMLGSRRTSLGPADVAVAQALADAATISILQYRTLHDERLLTGQLRQALASRIVIEQAKGVLCERWQTDMAHAFATMRDYARATNRRLSDVAADITTGELQLEDLSQSTG